VDSIELISRQGNHLPWQLMPVITYTTWRVLLPAWYVYSENGSKLLQSNELIDAQGKHLIQVMEQQYIVKT
jgi:hypothetical protein